MVRCSSCGGARQGNARRCGFCGADFTLHERDLNTVCPNCLARVSDKARYCSQCGEMLAAEAIAGKESNAVCPACPGTEHLASRELGHEKLNVLECQACTGLWLERGDLSGTPRPLGPRSRPLDEAVFAQARPRQRADQTGPLYRPCVECGKLMSRRQYAPGSGVIIDLCKDHGLWFDAAELHQVLTWIAEGGQSDDPIEAFERSNPRKPPCPPPEVYRKPEGNRDFLDEILGGILGSLFNFFRR